MLYVPEWYHETWLAADVDELRTKRLENAVAFVGYFAAFVGLGTLLWTLLRK
jgi:hypothetical protein